MKKREMRRLLWGCDDESEPPSFEVILDCIQRTRTDLGVARNERDALQIQLNMVKAKVSGLEFQNERLTSRQAVVEMAEKEALLKALDTATGEINQLKRDLAWSKQKESEPVSFALAAANNRIASLEAEIARVQCQLKTFEKDMLQIHEDSQ